MCRHHSTSSTVSDKAVTRPRGLVSRALFDAVRFYQKYLSPLKMGSTCRFDPTCSAYALGAFSRHGAVKGLVLTVVRLAKCGPWYPGGYDPVPARRSEVPRTTSTTKEF